MPVASAIKEFAPGRVSRRFGISHGNEKYWISNGTRAEIVIDKFCPPSARLDLGSFHFVNSDGILEEIRVFRPHALLVERTPINIQQSSNSFLEWRSEIVPADKGHFLDLPESRRWNPILQSIEIHSHRLGIPLEVRRFAKQLTASVGIGRQAAITTRHDFVYDSGNGQTSSGALGFATDVDGIKITFSYPTDIVSSVSNDPELVRGLRSTRFRDFLRTNSLLKGLANAFQIDWLAQIYQSVAVVAALRLGISLAEALQLEERGELSLVQDEVATTIFEPNWLEDDVSQEDTDDNSTAPHRVTRRLQELTALLADPTIRAALRDGSPVLWQPMDVSWESWLKSRFKATQQYV